MPDQDASAMAAAWRARAANLALGGAAAALFLAPSALMPRLLGYSAYIFGMAAVLLCARIRGAVCGLAAGAVVAVGAIFIDARSGVVMPQLAVRPILFIIIVAAVATADTALRRYQRASARALSELGEQKAVLQSVLDAGPNAMLMIDRHGLISGFSAAAEKLFGWRAEEVIGRNVGTLMPASFQGEHDVYLARYLEGGDPRVVGQSREVKGLRRDGTHFPMMLHVEEVRLGDERQFTGFVHDLTSLRAAQDRTHELRTQLTHIWSMNSLGEMAAILAHELNQPLASITNYVRAARTIAVRREPADDELLMAVGRAGDQAIRAGEIIRRMRDLIARKDTEHQMVSLAELISEIDFMIELVARDRNVMVRYALAEGPDEVLADRIQIQQVISNLVRNAVEAMKDSPTRILEIESVREAGGWTVTVGDSGPGVPPNMVEEIFEPLKSSKKQGMGLGLSISRAIIENHKGVLWVKQSRLGGAAFSFMLPLATSKEDRGGAEAQGWH